jgi:hypothetical protein
MNKLTDNNGFMVARGSKAKLMALVERQSRFDPTYALWLNGVRVL